MNAVIEEPALDGPPFEVNREARRRCAELLRDYLARRIDNDEFEDGLAEIPVDVKDLGPEDVRHASYWIINDRKRCKFCGWSKLTRAERRALSRWLLFLYSDAPSASRATYPSGKNLGWAVSTAAWVKIVGAALLLAWQYGLGWITLAVGSVVGSLAIWVKWVSASVWGRKSTWKMRDIFNPDGHFPFACQEDFEQANRSLVFLFGDVHSVTHS